MPDETTKSSKRVLEPSERISEVLFGLIMVLTFTGSLSVAEADRAEVRTMLIGALGCNIAWGIIDGVLYLMGCLAEKGRGLMIFRAVRNAADPQQAQRLIADALPSVVASVLQPAELEAMHQRLKQLPEPPDRAHLRQGRLAGCRRRFSLGIPVHVPGGDSVHFHAERRAGPARLQRDRHRDAVLDRLCLWEVCRTPAVADGHFHGRPRKRPGWTHHRTGRVSTAGRDPIAPSLRSQRRPRMDTPSATELQRLGMLQAVTPSLLRGLVRHDAEQERQFG